MPWGLKRFQQSHRLHFVTFSCYRRRANFVNAEAVGGTHAGLAREGSVLAGEVLRLQCVEREEIRGEAALYSSQPGGPWTGEQARRLALEQLPPLFDGRRGDGRDRIAMDGGGRRWESSRGCGCARNESPVQAPLGRGCSFVTSLSDGLGLCSLNALGTQALSAIPPASLCNFQLLSSPSELRER